MFWIALAIVILGYTAIVKAPEIVAAWKGNLHRLYEDEEGRRLLILDTSEEEVAGLLPGKTAEPSAYVVFTADGPIEAFADRAAAEEMVAEFAQIGTEAHVVSAYSPVDDHGVGQ